MNSENQAKLLDTLTSIARSLEAMLVRLDRIEDSLADVTDALGGEEGEDVTSRMKFEAAP